MESAGTWVGLGTHGAGSLGGSGYPWCRELGWVWVPMVVEAYGAWGAEAFVASGLSLSNQFQQGNVSCPLWQAKFKSS